MINRLVAKLVAESAERLKQTVGPDRRFMVVGWTRHHLNPDLSRWFAENDIHYSVWEYSPRGTLFLIHSHPDAASTRDAMLVKMGVAHDEEMRPLNARQLLDQNLVAPTGTPQGSIAGGALTLCVSQHEPLFSIYQSLTTTSQAYFWQSDDWILCSDTLRYLAAMVPSLEPEPDAVPHHLLYRTVPGAMTYIRDIYKLPGGHVATCHAGTWSVRQVERLDDWRPKSVLRRIRPGDIDAFERLAERVVSVYVAQAGAPHRLNVLLSGGVDSTLLASLVRSNLHPWDRLCTTGYAIRVPGFVQEMHYARQASRQIEIHHEFHDITAENYVDWLDRFTRLTAQPTDNEQDPCYLALAQKLAGHCDADWFLSGSASDTLLGNENARRLLQVERLQNIPGMGISLDAVSRMIRSLWPHKAHGMAEASRILGQLDDMLAPVSPLSRQGMFSDLQVVLRCFGDVAIRRVMEYRLDTLAGYGGVTPSLTETVHMAELMHDVHDEEAALVQAFRAWGIEIATPYLDSAYVCAVLKLDPRVRYCIDKQTKWLPKQILARRHGRAFTERPKLSGGFDHELFDWMRNGVLRDMVQDMERPAWMSAADWQQQRARPGWLTWNLLTMDLFRQHLSSLRPVREEILPPQPEYRQVVGG